MAQTVYRAGVVCVALALGSTLIAAEKSKPLPRPIKALQTATKNFVKAKSYHVELGVVGGYSEDAEHAVNQAVVRESYTGDVYAGVMHVPKVKAYRTMKAGTAYVDGNWRNILSDLNSAKMSRLFRFPEAVLGKAIQHAARSGEWVPVEGAAAKEGDKSAESQDVESRKAADDGPSGRTVVRSSQNDGEADSESAEPERPRVIRVEAPPTEALQHILEVQNSNCFGVG